MIHERELRAPIAVDRVPGLISFLLGQGASEAPEARRVLVDYSTFLEGIENRTRDIRVRSTDGAWEIVVKTGDFAAFERMEGRIPLGNVSAKEILGTMGLMGFTKGVVALRGIRKYQLGQIEVALQRVVNHYTPEDGWDAPEATAAYFVEVEIESDTDANGEIQHRMLLELLSRLSLAAFDKDAWTKFIRDLNETANGVFDFESPDWSTVERWEKLGQVTSK